MIFAVGLAVSATSGCGAAAEEKPPAAVYAFTFENDWAGGSDRNYSGGWFASRTSRLSEQGGRARYLQLGVAQQFYTPRYDFALRPLPEQHPYAALLYAEGKLAIDRGPGRPVDIFTVQLGVVGPWAQGEEVQNVVHDLIGQREGRGWRNQVGNDPIGGIGFERRWTGFEGRAGSLGIDLVPSLGAFAGNAFVAAQAGATLRLGRNLDRPLGEPRLEPSLGGIAWHAPASGGPRAAYGFFGVAGRAVGHKVWLDGRLGEDDIIEQDSEPLVYDLQGGFVLPIPGDARLAVTYMHRSSTFERFGEAQGLGAISIAARF